MKKAKAAVPKGGPAKTIDEYLARVPEPARTTLNKVRVVIRSVAPAEATETISYGIPTFKYKGSLVGFGAFAKHCSLFPMGASVLNAFERELKDFRVSKGTLHFPLDKPLPAMLIKKIVKARIAQNELKSQR
jgi:uncharacterized protein YdhG (YjbR/CyaY superfamily)